MNWLDSVSIVSYRKIT